MVTEVTDRIASIKFNWRPQVVQGDDPRLFQPNYVVSSGEANLSILSFKSGFADLPSAGIWENRTESDDELLEQLGHGWREFATER